MRKIAKNALIVLFALTLSVFPLTKIQETNAAWDASYIITNDEFTAKNTMSEAEIQAFLAAKGNYLENYTVPAARYKEWQGVNYYENPWIGPVGSEVNATGWKASKVIYNVAQWYNINPQAILATIQKESSLVTTTPSYYGLVQWAMGYAYTEGGIVNACSTATNNNPTGSCAGFAMQVDWGGGMLGYWGNNGGHYNYPVGSTKTIDGTSTYIGNAATSVLYAYTPHFHGNQNFRYFYELWFVPYEYSIVSASFPNSAQTSETKAYSLKIRNNGSATWYKGGTPSPKMRLRINSAGGLNSPNSVKIDGVNYFLMQQDSVASGEEADFVFNLIMPSIGGDYKMSVSPTINGDFIGEDPTYIKVKVLGKVPLYRFYNRDIKSHFYTGNKKEKDKLAGTSWIYEGIDHNVFNSNVSGQKPVYRFYSKKNRAHFYTTSITERDKIRQKYTDYEWYYEGTAFYVYKTQVGSSRAVYRFWNPITRKHFYTNSTTEKNKLINGGGWIYEGVAWYGV